MLDRIILKYRYLKTAVNSFYAFLVHAVYKTAFAPTAFVQEDMIAGKKNLYACTTFISLRKYPGFIQKGKNKIP